MHSWSSLLLWSAWAPTRRVNCNFLRTPKEGKQKYLKDFPRFPFFSSTETMEVGERVWCVCGCTTPAKGFLSYTFVYRGGGFKSLSVSSLYVLRLEIMHGGILVERRSEEWKNQKELHENSSRRSWLMEARIRWSCWCNLEANTWMSWWQVVIIKDANFKTETFST